MRKQMRKQKRNLNTTEFWNDQYSKVALSHPHQIVSHYHKSLYEKIVDLIFHYRHNNILDLGAGVGPVPFLMKRRNFDFKDRKYICVDFSKIGLQRAKEVVPGITTHVARVDEPLVLPYKEGSFDIVVCTEVLEHLTNYLECLKNISRFLSKDGVAIVSVPFGKIMITTHYHMNIPTDTLAIHHEAVNLFPFATNIIDRWQVMQSRKVRDKDVRTSFKTSSRQVIANLCIREPDKSSGKNICN